MIKTILVNWTFKSEYCTNPEAPSTIWTCNDEGYRFICTNLTDTTEIEKIIVKCASDGELLILLHKNPPHNSTLKDIDTMCQNLKNRKGKFVIRLFGGGTESLYFGPKSDLGILGDRNKGLFATFYETNEPQYKKGRSQFIINRDTKTVDVVNLKYIWRNYWEAPKKTVYSLMEDFRLHTDGFNFEQDANAYISHLKTNETLFNALQAFANPPKDDVHTPTFQYSLKTLQDHLEKSSDHHDTLSNLQQLRGKVSGTLTGENIVDHSSHLREIYTGMFQLFQQIPVNL